MEETSRRGILGRHRSCNSESVEILSDSIECNHPSRNTSSLLYSESCQTENWRSLIRQSIHVTSTSAKDLTEARMDKRIGFENCSTTRTGKLLDNKKEKLLDKQTFSNQPNQLQIQFVTDRGDLMTCKMEETHPIPRRSMLILLTKNSVLQTERCDLLKQT